MSDWSGELIDTTQPTPPDMDINEDREDIRDNPIPSDWTDQDNFWSGKTYDKVRAQSTLKPAPPNPPPKEMRTVSGVNIYIHTTIELKLPRKSHYANPH